VGGSGSAGTYAPPMADIFRGASGCPPSG
jgi:hypothetical protein